MKIKLRVGGSYWENKANQILNDVEIKTLTMPLSFSPKRNIVFVCCNCRAEFSIDSELKALIVQTAMLYLRRMKMEVILNNE
jgi:hypothetical protein